MRFELYVDEKDSYRALGQVVRYQRLKNKYSLRELGSLSNISHTLISNIEKGRVISHPDTLKELLLVLGINFNSDNSLIDDFKVLYDQAFNLMFEFEYTKAKVVMDKIIANDNIYMNSIVTSDYLGIKFLYLALTDQVYGENVEMFDTAHKIYEYLGDNQKQIFNLTYGVYKFNYGLFGEAYEYFKKAKSVGSASFDMLIDNYIVKTYVKMYRFMDAITLSDQLIGRLEKDLLYLRALEVRLTIVYAYVIVQKIESALESLDKIYRLTASYRALYIKSECDMLYSVIYFKKGNYELAHQKIQLVVTNDLFVIYLKLKLAYVFDDTEKVLQYYEEFKVINAVKKFKKSEYLMKIVMFSLGLEKIEEKELTKMFKYLINFSKKAVDIEFMEAVYSLYIGHCKKRKMYKLALELSEDVRQYRKNGGKAMETA